MTTLKQDLNALPNRCDVYRMTSLYLKHGATLTQESSLKHPYGDLYRLELTDADGYHTTLTYSTIIEHVRSERSSDVL